MATPFILPTIAATTPTIVDGVTYDRWAVTLAITIEATPGGLNDPSGPEWPRVLRWTVIKGRIHADGYFESAPGVDPVTYQIDRLMDAAQNDPSLQNMLTVTINQI